MLEARFLLQSGPRWRALLLFSECRFALDICAYALAIRKAVGLNF